MPKPRVAIAYDCLFPINTGGGERVYRRMAEVLVERGCTVDYVTRGQWAPGEAPQAGFTVTPVWRGPIYDASGTRTPASALAFAGALFAHFRRHRGDYDLAVVSALPVLNVFAARLALAGSGTFLVTDWLEVWSWPKWRRYSGALVGTVASVLQFIALRVGDLHTVNSRFTRARVRGYRHAADPVVLGLVDLVDLVEPVGHSTDAATSPPPVPTVLFVGRHIADKRLAALPAALAVARRTLPGLRAIIVGSGPETAVVRDRVAQLGLDDAVHFAGRVSEAELLERFAGASVLVNPSAREGFGLVIAEAAACATPSVVVAGEDNAAAELVENGVNGFVASSVQADVLGAAIVAAVEAGEPLRRSTLGWFLRERERNALSASVDEILARYRSARAR
ncbi:glycosyltransferase [Cryobacterium algoritolerans]|uniref:D-inositol 3-phosphate glycosyltransferase n=1 Tax=Cryobacterium algoritolerans TaxID=1259184 RepID=A0A4R8WZ17_9MICO|nr:glycosyltransferase family 4 protein [Cryobacterium algoritolerans]TFC19209.1 glycosyltransferase [Cryobacterium algoritolerans]